jgi:SAM-dependent methyltransferase
MDYKAKTVSTYDTFPKRFDEKFEKHFQLYVRPEAERFIHALQGNGVLDLGSGPGNHAAYFQQQGLDVLCVDLSDEMLKKCREKKLKAIKADIEDLALFPTNSYNGIWSYASVIHVPKRKLPGVVSDIARILAPQGILGLAVKEGDGEGLESHEDFPGTQRWFSYFKSDEVQSFFKPFEVIHSIRSPSKNGGKTVFLEYLMRKK